MTIPAPPTPEIRLTVLAVPSSVVLARELVRYALTNWGFERNLIHDSMLVMSEIVSNAVTAAPGHHIRLRCTLQEEAPLLECWDPSPALPRSRNISGTAENGRGLMIITAFAEGAGTRPSATGEGKIVWALMPA
ncbi:ATP-binding protein [Actinomadura chokoriensis]